MVDYNQIYAQVQQQEQARTGPVNPPELSVADKAHLNLAGMGTTASNVKGQARMKDNGPLTVKPASVNDSFNSFLAGIPAGIADMAGQAVAFPLDALTNQYRIPAGGNYPGDGQPEDPWSTASTRGSRDLRLRMNDALGVDPAADTEMTGTAGELLPQMVAGISELGELGASVNRAAILSKWERTGIRPPQLDKLDNFLGPNSLNLASGKSYAETMGRSGMRVKDPQQLVKGPAVLNDEIDRTLMAHNQLMSSPEANTPAIHPDAIKNYVFGQAPPLGLQPGEVDSLRHIQNEALQAIDAAAAENGGLLTPRQLDQIKQRVHVNFDQAFSTNDTLRNELNYRVRSGLDEFVDRTVQHYKAVNDHLYNLMDMRDNVPKLVNETITGYKPNPSKTAAKMIGDLKSFRNPIGRATRDFAESLTTPRTGVRGDPSDIRKLSNDAAYLFEDTPRPYDPVLSGSNHIVMPPDQAGPNRPMQGDERGNVYPPYVNPEGTRSTFGHDPQMGGSSGPIVGEFPKSNRVFYGQPSGAPGGTVIQENDSAILQHAADTRFNAVANRPAYSGPAMAGQPASAPMHVPAQGTPLDRVIQGAFAPEGPTVPFSTRAALNRPVSTPGYPLTVEGGISNPPGYAGIGPPSPPSHEVPMPPSLQDTTRQVTQKPGVQFGYDAADPYQPGKFNPRAKIPGDTPIIDKSRPAQAGQLGNNTILKDQKGSQQASEIAAENGWDRNKLNTADVSLEGVSEPPAINDHVKAVTAKIKQKTQEALDEIERQKQEFLKKTSSASQKKKTK